MFDTENKLQEVVQLWAKDDYRSALNALEVILEKCPDTIEALSLMGHILDEQALNQGAGQELLFAKARRCYEKILTLLPDHPQTTIDLGDFWRRKKKYDNALEFYDKAIRLLHCEDFDSSTKDDLKDVYHEKLLILEEIGNYSEYKKTLNKAKIFFPNSKLFQKLGTDPN